MSFWNLGNWKRFPGFLQCNICHIVRQCLYSQNHEKHSLYDGILLAKTVVSDGNGVPVWQKSALFTQKTGSFLNIRRIRWKRKSSSVTMNVTVGNTRPSLFGFASILETQPYLVVNGKPLTKAEISAMLKMEEGLSLCLEVICSLIATLLHLPREHLWSS